MGLVLGPAWGGSPVSVYHVLGLRARDRTLRLIYCGWDGELGPTESRRVTRWDLRPYRISRMSYGKKEIWGSLRKTELGLGARTVVLLLDDIDMELNLSETQSRIYKLVV